MNIISLKNELGHVIPAGSDAIEMTDVSGGSINHAFCLTSAENRWFVKAQQSSQGDRMFEAEESGLEILRSTGTFRIPEVIGRGTCEGCAYLVLEWIEQGKGRDHFGSCFGRSLAALHQTESDHFGLPYDNFIGSLIQSNRKWETWHEFYASERILPMVKQLVDSGYFGRNMIQSSDALTKRLPELIPEEKPALLHGDLWCGNYLIDEKGLPVLIDPAVYFGHRETDLAMMKLFGGFGDDIFDHYHEAFPLTGGWRERIPLFQLYPVLVHAVLFGGGYVGQAAQIIGRYC